jgi:hypothetical protein
MSGFIVCGLNFHSFDGSKSGLRGQLGIFSGARTPRGFVLLSLRIRLDRLAAS